MKNIALVELYSPGIIIFDPEVLACFLKNEKIHESNIFDFFLEKENLGRAAIEQGILFPIYQIPEAEYSIFLSEDLTLFHTSNGPAFRYDQLPLQVTSGIVIVSDLNALFDWDADFFNNYLNNYENKLANNDYLNVPNGLYSMSISGYTGLKPPLAPLGYALEFKPVISLPKIFSESSIDDWNFSLEIT